MAASRPEWPNAISPMRWPCPAPSLAHPEELERIVGGVAYIRKGDCYEYKSLACCLGCVSSLHRSRYYNVSRDLFPGQKEYGFLLIAVVLGVVGLLEALFINSQPDPL